MLLTPPHPRLAHPAASPWIFFILVMSASKAAEQIRSRSKIFSARSAMRVGGMAGGSAV
jgi:hypothetical protein